MANFEENGIKEKEFNEIFNFEPICTLAEFGDYLYGSKILTKN